MFIAKSNITHNGRKEAASNYLFACWPIAFAHWPNWPTAPRLAPQAIRSVQFIVRQRQFRQTPKCQNSFPKLPEYVKPLVTSCLCGRPGISQDGFLDLCVLSEISSRTTPGRKQQAISHPSETRSIPPARGISQDRSVLDRPLAAVLAFLKMVCLFLHIANNNTTHDDRREAASDYPHP